jgi:hypothetical protein
MKMTKLGILATAATLALCVSSAKAAPFISVVTNYSKLNVSLTVVTNGQWVNSGTTEKLKTGQAKIGNKQLLDLFAGWSDSNRTNEPWKSAQLVIGWDPRWEGDVLVVDKTGTNVLFDADYQDDAYFYVDFVYDSNWGAYNETRINDSPGSVTWTAMNSAYFELLDNNYYLDYTSLGGYGGSLQDFKQSWDASGYYKDWTDSQNAKFNYAGGQYYLDYGSETTVSGNITADGNGKGLNGYWYVVEPSVQ